MDLSSVQNVWGLPILAGKVGKEAELKEMEEQIRQLWLN